jgi:hypothetical protein
MSRGQNQSRQKSVKLELHYKVGIVVVVVVDTVSILRDKDNKGVGLHSAIYTPSRALKGRYEIAMVARQRAGLAVK